MAKLPLPRPGDPPLVSGRSALKLPCAVLGRVVLTRYPAPGLCWQMAYADGFTLGWKLEAESKDKATLFESETSGRSRRT